MTKIPNAGPTRILLIEDESPFVFLIKRALDAESFAYELTSLEDGAEALALIRRKGKYARSARPGLIVMDLHLPRFDGLEILAAARASAEFAHVPVAVLSGSDSPEERERVAAFKATYFLEKPMHLDGFPEIARRIKELAMHVQEVTFKAAP